MVIWIGKWLILAATGLAASLSVAIALSLPNIYTASALQPRREFEWWPLGCNETIRWPSKLSRRVASRGERGVSCAAWSQLMKSRAFIGDFVTRRDIMPTLMAVDTWDARSGNVVYDPEIYDAVTKKWVRDVEPPKLPEPSAQEAHSAFVANLGISQDSQTGYVTVRIDHQSPIVASQWVTWLVEDLNATVKAQEVAEASRSIEYLKQQVASTSLADLQAMFFELIQSQTETVMLAEVRPEYVFKTIDPAVFPNKRVNPVGH